MGSQERLADRLYPGEGGLTGHTRVRRGPTRRVSGLPHQPMQEPRGVDSGSVPEHALRSDSDRPRSQVFHRISEDAVETWAPHLLKVQRAREKGEAPVSVKELVRAVKNEVERQMPPARYKGLEMKRRGKRREDREQKPQVERKKHKRRSRKGGRADAPRREPRKKQKKNSQSLALP